MGFKGFLYLCWCCLLLSFTGFYFTQWKYIPEKAQVKFFVKEEKAEEAGVFAGIAGKVIFDPNMPEKACLNAEIATKTINTGVEMRDESLRSKDFFEVAKYPKITFASDSIIKTDTGYLVIGKLTIKKTTKQQAIPFRFLPDEAGAQATFKGMFTINRYDFGVGAKDDGVGNMVRIELEIPVKKQ
jgi:polyisoprenoid-binding protein YceI